MSQRARPARSRVNMRIPTELLRWAKRDAKKRNTSLTQTFIEFLRSRRVMEEEPHVRRVG